MNQIELRIRLTDGSFDTSVVVPTNASEASRSALMRTWYKLIEEALAIAAEVRPSDAPKGENS